MVLASITSSFLHYAKTLPSLEVYLVVAVAYLVLSALYRFAFWLIGLGLFERKRRLGTSL